MWRTWLCACATLVCACGEPGTAARDAGGDAAPAGDATGDAVGPQAECAALRTEWQTIVAGLARSCTGDGDCAWVGGAPASPSVTSCNCHPWIGGGCGTSVNGTAYVATNAGTIAQEYNARCLESAFGVCDCGEFTARCATGSCVAVEVHCCMCPPDAGAGDAPGDTSAPIDAGTGDAAFSGVIDVNIVVEDNCDVHTSPTSITVPTGTEFTVNWINSVFSASNVDVDKVDQYNQVPIVIGLEPGQSYHDTVREWCGTLFTGTFDFRLTGCYQPYSLPVDCGG